MVRMIQFLQHNNFKLMKFIFVNAIVLLLLVSACYSSELDTKISWLYNRLQSRYWNEDQPFRNPKQPQHIKGLYQSHIHLNFIDKKNSRFMAEMRKQSLDDNNMFVTSFVLYSLIQTSELGTIQLNDHQISMSLQTLSTFRDKNTPYGTPQYNFWPQNFVNGTWIAQPTNLLNVANMIPGHLPKPVMFLMEKLGLDIIFAMKDLVNVFTIPADNDDSGVNLALMGLLKQTKSKHFLFWKNFNFNVEDYYRRVLKYAYRPFDSNFTDNKFANEIDPRVYYLYNEFFSRKKAEAKAMNQTASLILPTTWLINYEEQINGMIRMPFSNNNVDATVCANVLFGISYLALNDELNLDNIPELKQLIENTGELLAYVIEQKIAIRPDLALVYYPSKYDFFWFVSRIINLYRRQDKLPEIFDTVYKTLWNAMKTKGTEIFLKSAQNHKQGEIYWSQFLGNYANKTRNQDSIFSTSLALNALLDSWTYRKGKIVKYIQNTPTEVQNMIQKGVNYLKNNLKKNSKQYNAFFSGSWKSQQTNPYIYPANIHVDKNNKNIDPMTGTFNDIKPGMNYVMKGYIEADEYKKLISQKWFGYDVPTEFKGFNSSPFPYWSAQPITEVIALSVFSKYSIITEKSKLKEN